MLKYINLEVDNYLLPQETILKITLCDESNNRGVPLFIRELQRLLERYKDITGVVFIGADHKPALITYWTNYVFKHFKNLKIGWISKSEYPVKCLPLRKMDYLKLKDDWYQKNYETPCTSFDKAWFKLSINDI